MTNAEPLKKRLVESRSVAPTAASPATTPAIPMARVLVRRPAPDIFVACGAFSVLVPAGADVGTLSSVFAAMANARATR